MALPETGAPARCAPRRRTGISGISIPFIGPSAVGINRTKVLGGGTGVQQLAPSSVPQPFYHQHLLPPAPFNNSTF